MSAVENYVDTIFASRTADAEAMLKAELDGEEYEGQDASDAIAEFPLAIDPRVHVVITFGMGGPGDDIDCTLVRTHYGYELDAATYRAYWGSESKETRLREGDALWTLAERYIEGIDLNNE